MNSYIVSGRSPVNSDYDTLMETYLQPLVLEYSMYKALPFLNWSLTNKAIVRKEADNTISSEVSDIKFLQAQYKDSGDFIGQRCIEFLMQSYIDGKYPLYSASYNSNLDDIQPSKESPYFYGGIYLADSFPTYISPENGIKIRGKFDG